MKEYKFRGKRIDIDNDNSEWIYGDLISTDPYRIVDLKQNNDSYVLGPTVGQYIGFNDKNDIEIYEGDILNVIYSTRDGLIQHTTYTITDITAYNAMSFLDLANEIEVICNIYEKH